MSTETTSRSRLIWALFVAGPVIWFGHFMVVYLIAEAVCAINGSSSRVLGLRPVSLVTLVATAVAVVATALLTRMAYRCWRAQGDPPPDWLDDDDERGRGLALAGALLGGVFVLAILFVGAPAAFLDPC